MREAERRQLRLALSLSATPWGIPSPREGLELAGEYDSARLGLVLDPARLSVMRRLGLAISGERLAALRAAAALVVENEAVGIDAGYLPGLGERDDDLAARAGVGADTPSVLVGRPDSTDAEVRRRAACAGALRRFEDAGQLFGDAVLDRAGQRRQQEAEVELDVNP